MDILKILVRKHYPNRTKHNNNNNDYRWDVDRRHWKPNKKDIEDNIWNCKIESIKLRWKTSYIVSFII